jgi:hypothetical protein
MAVLLPNPSKKKVAVVGVERGAATRGGKGGGTPSGRKRVL